MSESGHRFASIATVAVVGTVAAYLVWGVTGGLAAALLGALAVAFQVRQDRSRGSAIERFATERGLEFEPSGKPDFVTRRMWMPMFDGSPGVVCHNLVSGQFTGSATQFCLTHLVRSRDGTAPTTSEFTLCGVRLPLFGTRWDGIFVTTPGKLSRGDDLPKDVRPASLESIDFDNQFELHVAERVDEVAIRQLFQPSMIRWLVDAPIPVCFQCRAGALVVYTYGIDSDPTHLDLIIEGARRATSVLQPELQRAA